MSELKNIPKKAQPLVVDTIFHKRLSIPDTYVNHDCTYTYEPIIEPSSDFRMAAFNNQGICIGYVDVSRMGYENVQAWMNRKSDSVVKEEPKEEEKQYILDVKFNGINQVQFHIVDEDGFVIPDRAVKRGVNIQYNYKLDEAFKRAVEAYLNQFKA